jgi:hypothetical protein
MGSKSGRNITMPTRTRIATAAPAIHVRGTAVNGLYVLRLARIVFIESLTDALDALHDRFVGSCAAGPDFLDQHVLADNTGIMARERDQRIHLFRFQMDVLAFFANDASFGNYFEWPEFEAAPQIRSCCHATTPSVIFRGSSGRIIV